MAKLIRINTRVSESMNEWLDQQAERTGISKSTLVMLALDSYRQQKEVKEQMGLLNELVAKLEGLDNKIEFGQAANGGSPQDGEANP